MQEEKENIANTPTPENHSEAEHHITWWQFIKKFVFSTLKNFLLFVLSLLLVAVLLLQFSFTQTFIAKLGFNFLSQQLRFKVETTSFYLDIFNSKLYLENLSIRDLQGKQMLFTEQLYCDFDYSTISQKNGDVLVQDLLLKRGSINLIIDEKTKELNVIQFIDIIDSLTAPKVRKPKKKPALTWVQNIRIEDTYLSYSDNTSPFSESEGMDYAHFSLDEMNVELKNLRIVGDTIESQINNFKGKELKSKVDLKNLTTLFRMTKQTMEFHKLLCEVDNSILRDEIFMSYEKQKDLKDFVNKVTIIAHLDSSVIHTKDLAVFAPEVKKFDDVWRVRGTFKGKVNDLSVKGMDLYFGTQSHLHGDAEMSGLPDIQKTFMDFRFNQSQFVASELEKYIDQKDITDVINKFGFVRFKGNFTGFLSDFVGNGVFQTDLGYLQSDINLKLKENRQDSYYKGNLKTKDLDIGKLFDSPALQIINLDGNIEGTGFSPEVARFKLDAQVNSLVYNRYNYQDIRVDGFFSRKHFEGEMIARDKNFNFDINGEIDFNKDNKNPNAPPGRFKLKSKIEQINLQALNFIPTETIIKGNITLDTYGLSLDSLIGEAVLSDAFVLYNGKALDIKSVDLLSFKQDNGEHFFEIRSEFFDFLADGNFIFSEVIRDLQELIDEYVLSFRNDVLAIEKYYKRKKLQNLRKYALEFNVNAKNINPLVALFVKDIYISKDTRLFGNFSHSKASSFTIYTKEKENIDSLFYGKNKLYDIKIDLNTSKIATTKDILAEGVVSSQKQIINGIGIENTSFDAFWGDDVINFDFITKQANSSNLANLTGVMRFSNDTTSIIFRPSNFIFLDEKWLISKENEININNKGIVFDNVVLYNENAPESNISLDGVVSDTIKLPLDIRLKNIELLSFANLVNQDIRGTLNSDILLNNLYKNPEASGTLDLENLVYDKILIGDLEGNVNWDNQKDNLNIQVDCYRKGRYILDLSGNYQPHATKNALNLIADLRKTDLEIVEPFAKDLISNLRGTALGKLFIKGTIAEPIVTGQLEINNGEFMMNYLKTTYGVEGIVKFDANEIAAKDMLLLDAFNNPANLNASVFHDGFKDIYLQVSSKFYNFQLLNTTAKDNSLFYGDAFATGSLAIHGFLNNLQMDINARSRKGTKLAIPMDGYQEVAQQDYIRFVKPNQGRLDSLNTNKIDLGGLKLNFNLDVTSDAEFEIIFDLKAGDIIKGKGRGNIDMKIDTDGTFNIFGNYIIQEGKYNFTFANLVNKGFDIASGSRINFNGDIFASTLDINAIYNKNVSLKPLIDLESVPDPNNREYTRSYPVKAIMGMNGKFLSPEIKLNLDLSEAKKTPNTFLQTAVLQLESQIQNNEQERNRQVFSLLILNRLSPQNAFAVSGTDSWSSLSELLSNQFSNWISQVDENLELSFDVNPSDLNTFQLKFSYSLLDGRLRVTREGGFTNAQNQTDFGSVFGDWTVEYLLDPNGKFRIKTYYRNNQNVISGANLNNANTAVTGASILHTANFNNLNELFSSKNRKRRKAQNTPLIAENENQKNQASEEETVVREPEWELKEKLPKQSILISGDSTKTELMPIRHRNGGFKPKEKDETSLEIESKKQGTQKWIMNDTDIQKQYLEGDADNEPMPEDLRKIELEKQAKKQLIQKQMNEPHEILSISHRFDFHKKHKREKHLK